MAAINLHLGKESRKKTLLYALTTLDSGQCGTPTKPKKAKQKWLKPFKLKLNGKSKHPQEKTK
jgi:hypothetical protein